MQLDFWKDIKRSGLGQPGESKEGKEHILHAVSLGLIPRTQYSPLQELSGMASPKKSQKSKGENRSDFHFVVSGVWPGPILRSDSNS